MSQVVDALKWRYAVKKFDNKRLLPKHKIDVIKETFNLTATSFGLQPVRLVIIKNKELQKDLVAHSMNQQQVADCSHLLVFCIERTVDSTYVNTYFNRVKEVRNTPDDILKPFKDYLLDVFEKEPEEDTLLWAAKQAYLAMGNLLTVCALENIDACPMEGFNPQGYDEKLHLGDKGLKSVLVMPIGYRDQDDMFAGFKKVRKELQNVIIEL